MPDYRSTEHQIQQLLASDRRPVAVCFQDEPPKGVAKFEGSEPSSCSFWRIAAAGRTFYTVPSDHLNCPIGGYTQNMLPPERMPELQQTLALMSDIGYIRMEEIPGVFQLPQSPKVVVYAPLADAPSAPSLVLAAGKPGRVMMLAEAAIRAGAMSSLPLLARPTCMALPAALANGAVTSTGCIGNRVYTDIGEDELYIVLRGADLERIAAQIDTIQSANHTLTQYHRERRRTLTMGAPPKEHIMPKRTSFASVELDVNPGADRAPQKPAADSPFRILLLGDFSGRVNREAASSPSRKPVAIDRDNFDQVLASMGAELHLGGGKGSPRIILKFRELEDFHPDRIYQSTEIFRVLRETRRKLEDPSTFAEAAAAVKGFAGAPAPQRREPLAAPPNLAALTGGSLLENVLDATETRLPPAGRRADDLQSFIDQAVAPLVVPRQDPQLSELVAQVDAATAKLMRAILHHKDFQALEAAWRGVFFLVRNLETGADLKLYLLDISKAELAADLHRLLVGDAADPLGVQPWAVAAGNFTFDRTESDIRTLGQLAGLMRMAGAPFLAEADPASDTDSSESAEHWDSLRHSPAAVWLGLALPRFLLRLPYGKETEPVESFPFEEMPGAPDHGEYLWGNPAFACACLLGQAFSDEGWDLRPGSHNEIGGLPLHVYEEGGEKLLKPCAELLMTETDAEWILEQGLMPLVSLKNQDVVKLLRFQSIAEPLAPLSGRWS